MEFVRKIKKYIEEEVLNDEFVTLEGSKKKIRECFLFYIELYESIKRHQTFNTAAALAFKSIVALVPMIFIGIAVASMLGVTDEQNYVNSFITSLEEKIPDVPELQPLLSLIRGFALKAREIVGLSFVVLFYVAYSLLAYIERSFNSIWQVEVKRKFLNRIVAYLSLVVIVPIMMSFSVYLNSKVETATLKMAHSIEQTKNEAYEMLTTYLPFYDVSVTLTPKDKTAQENESDKQNMSGTESYSQQPFFVKLVLGVFSFLLTSSAVGLLIYFMPNTHVKVFPAIIGGCCSGIILEAMKFGFSMYVNYAATNLTRLYGSTLLVAPLFLLWMWLVWAVILLGVEISFNIQNYYDLVASRQLKRNNISFTYYLAVRVVYDICEAFYDGKTANNVIDSTARKFVVPPLIIRKIIESLLAGEIIRVVDSDRFALMPGRDIAHLTMYDVYKSINTEKFYLPDEKDDILHRIIGDIVTDTGNKLSSGLQAHSILELIEQKRMYSQEAVENGAVTVADNTGKVLS